MCILSPRAYDALVTEKPETFNGKSRPVSNSTCIINNHTRYWRAVCAYGMSRNAGAA
jgi:hypothetical protein